jgi:hypothetical protein
MSENPYSTVGQKRLLNNIRGHTDDLRFINLSFSISGEDLVLRALFKSQMREGRPGFYVDVGCCDPRNASNTYLFYCYGWRGICIDANPQFAKPYAVYRPRDLFLNAAVTDNSAAAFHFAKHKINHGMSEVKPVTDAFGDDFGPSEPVPSLSLSEALASHLPDGQGIDFMSMDLEGAEPGALASNDWSRFRPKAIVIETQYINEERPLEYTTVAFLKEQGYGFRGFVGGNVIMVLPG